MKLPSYPRTKPSSVKWLGDVPEDWEVKRLRYLCSIRKGRLPAETFPSATSDGDLPYLSMEFLRGETNAPNFVARAPRLVCAEAGDLLLLWDGSNAGEFLRAKKGVVSSTVARLETREVERGFLAYACKALEPQIKDQTVGMGIPHVSGDELKSCSLPYPDSTEQRAIAAFLDRETGRVDRLVAKKGELIERLKEKRTALISRTVTRGLPPAAARAAGLSANPLLKSSGVEWLGDIPKHWEAVALKHLVSVPIIDGPHETPAKQDSGIPFVSAEAVANGSIDFGKIWGYISDVDHKRFSKRYKPTRGDVLLIKLGATTGTPAIVDTDLEFNVWVPLAAIRLKSKMMPRLLLHILRSRNLADAYQLYWTFGTQQTLGLKTISELRMPVPPLPEQAAIAAYLDEWTAKLDALVVKVEEAVERLQEYRTALITAAVTGKIDVRTANQR